MTAPCQCICRSLMQLLSICTQEYMDVNLFNFIFHQFLKSSFHLNLSRAFLITGIFLSPRPSWWYPGNHSNSSFTNPPLTDELTVTWTPPTTGGILTGYNVTINDSSSPVVIADNGSPVYTHTFTGLVSDTLYMSLWWPSTVLEPAMGYQRAVGLVRCHTYASLRSMHAFMSRQFFTCTDTYTHN